MDPELRDMLLVCADRAEELGDEVAMEVLHRLADTEGGRSLEGFGRRLLYIARYRDLLGPGASPARPEFKLEYANEPWNRPPRELGQR